ncbi:MAG: methylated-DNA--[protein]-cysteine S-methyltransferase [Desulfuromonas sp.]|nr:methylated-DNA--[protein]-cysteine S-methyltransferase [Desulfuromonas sp.]
MTYYTTFHSPFCNITLVGNEQGLTNLHLHSDEGKCRFEIAAQWVRNDPFFTDTIEQLTDYFSGQRHTFAVKLNPQGSDFQQRVWDELTTIDYGELVSYKEIAVAIDNANAARAVGMANSKNPIPLIIPCHRVIGANGRLTGFAHGLTIKKKLISLEQTGTIPC